MKYSVAVYLLKRFIKLRKLIYVFKAHVLTMSLRIPLGIAPHFTGYYI